MEFAERRVVEAASGEAGEQLPCQASEARGHGSRHRAEGRERAAVRLYFHTAHMVEFPSTECCSACWSVTPGFAFMPADTVNVLVLLAAARGSVSVARGFSARALGAQPTTPVG